MSIFGTPDAKGTWGFRWEGHHLSLNFTLVDGELVSSTPSFFATNPGKIKEGQPGPVGFELLKFEDDLGRELAKSLTAEQRKKAFLAKDPFKDILTGNKQRANGIIKHQGHPGDRARRGPAPDPRPAGLRIREPDPPRTSRPRSSRPSKP